MIKLLLIEDDTNLSYIIKSSLEEIIGDYEVNIAANGVEGLSLLETICPDIIVSDIEMPGMNGVDMVKKIRQTDAEVPIIFATGKVSPKDVITGYGAGANYYVKKPFLPEELDAHIKSLINLRTDTKVRIKNAQRQIGKYLFDTKNNCLIYNSKRQKLTGRESQILELLLDNKGEVVRRDDILLKFWETNDFYTSRSLDVFINNIRSYLENDDAIKITNIKRVGLLMNFD
ncbi:MAG: response regulator transcription factor [Dysgonamonadaceae bacterium]|jgi:DNA-binding response OmpR family regulator|nr:response regulator transcription factor [Dysgonamonadaceae bacterium]